MFELDPVHPLPPQRFEVNDINCHSITFSWSPPFHNGGVPIMVYNLSFYQSSPVYNQNAGKLTKKVNETPDLIFIAPSRINIYKTNINQRIF